MTGNILKSVRAKDRRRLGQCAETLVGHWYKARGYEVIHQNLYLGQDELDLVVRRGATVRVVEVRSSWTRDAHDLAWTVPGKKAHKLKRATRKLIYSGLIADAVTLHIDLALVRWVNEGLPDLCVWESALSLSDDG